MNCDVNGNGAVPFFCDRAQRRRPAWHVRLLRRTTPGRHGRAAERQCNIDCIDGPGRVRRQGLLRATDVQRLRPVRGGDGRPRAARGGPRRLARRRTQIVAVSAAQSRATTTAIPPASRAGPGARVVRHAGALQVRRRDGDGHRRRPAAGRPTRCSSARWRAAEQHVAVLADGDVAGRGQCHVALNSRTRINVVTRDAVPGSAAGLQRDDPDAERGRQCRLLRGATYDVAGHLRQVQRRAGRGGSCCRATRMTSAATRARGECPRPIKPCPAEVP